LVPVKLIKSIGSCLRRPAECASELEWPLRRPGREFLRPYALQLWKRDIVLANSGPAIGFGEIAPYTKQLVIRSLRVENPKLIVAADSICYEATKIPTVAISFYPMHSHNSGYKSFLRQFETDLQCNS